MWAGRNVPLAAILVVPPREVKSADEFIDLLRNWLPTADVTRDDSIAGLVHVREKSLDVKGKTILDDKVSLTFDGPVGDLFPELKRMSNGALQEDQGLAIPLNSI